MNTTQLKSEEVLKQKVDVLYEKYKTEMYPKFVKLANEHGYDFNHVFELEYTSAFALSSSYTDDNQNKFLKLAAAMSAISNIIVWIDPKQKDDMQRDIEKLQLQVHEYDAPWYNEVVDQIRIMR